MQFVIKNCFKCYHLFFYENPLQVLWHLEEIHFFLHFGQVYGIFLHCAMDKPTDRVSR